MAACAGGAPNWAKAPPMFWSPLALAPVAKILILESIKLCCQGGLPSCPKAPGFITLVISSGFETHIQGWNPR